MPFRRNRPNPVRTAFKIFLNGKKENYPFSIDNESNPAFKKYAECKLDVDDFNAYDCTDIAVLHVLYQGLFDGEDQRAKRALIYGSNSCRPALADYAEFLRANGTATNDKDKLEFKKID